VNETLPDVETLSPYFEHMFGDKNAFKEWFSLLLLHSEAATLAGSYFDFGTLAGATLDMVGTARSQPVAEAEKKRILEAIVHLPCSSGSETGTRYPEERRIADGYSHQLHPESG
jgi:2-haloacid dehalogenase